MKKISHTYAHPTNIQEMLTVAHQLARAGFGNQNESVCYAIIQYGAEMGIGPMQSVMGIHLMQGKFTLDATLVAAVIQRTGKYKYRIKTLTTQLCEIEFYDGDELLGVSSFSEEDRKRAGLNSGTWKKYPKQMMRARAVTNGARNFVPECFMGPVYVPEELESVHAEAPSRGPEKPKELVKPSSAMLKMAKRIKALAEEKCPGHGEKVVSTILERIEAESLDALSKEQLMSVGKKLKAKEAADLYEMIGVESPLPTEGNIEAVLTTYSHLPIGKEEFRTKLKEVTDIKSFIEYLDAKISFHQDGGPISGDALMLDIDTYLGSQ